MALVSQAEQPTPRRKYPVNVTTFAKLVLRTSARVNEVVARIELSLVVVSKGHVCCRLRGSDTGGNAEHSEDTVLFPLRPIQRIFRVQRGLHSRSVTLCLGELRVVMLVQWE